MIRLNKSKCLALALASGITLAPVHVVAEDIDIFTGLSAGSSGNPNVLIVVDNTSNWDRASQQWPDEPTQGEAEMTAIKNVVANLTADVNVGLMMWTRNGTGGGYVRFAMRPMDATNKALLMAAAQQVHDNVNGPTYKGPSNAAYGGIMMDAWKYFGGYANSAGTNSPTDATHFGPDVYLPDTGCANCGPPDIAAYTSTAWTRFVPAIAANAGCAKNYVIFIGNNGPSTPNTDSASLITGVGGSSAGLVRPAVANGTMKSDIGFSNTCSLPGSPSTAPYTVAANCSIGALVANTNVKDATAVCSTGQDKFMVQCAFPGVAPTGTTFTASDGRLADNWAQFMYQGDASSQTDQQSITTYTLDAYNAQVSNSTTSMLMNMATVSGGTYFAVKSLQQIQTALQKIFDEILAVNSAFASASLPISATNRELSNNEVYIGMFRPDAQAKPRWMGNMKRYQLIPSGTGVQLGDALGAAAVDNITGFVGVCAQSYYTSDSPIGGTGGYWQDVFGTPPAEGKCSTSSFSKWSDAPDGPLVEKGAVGEVLRKGNNPPTTDGTPTWAVNRTVFTLNSGGSALATFDVANSGLATGLVDWVSGKDTQNERVNNPTGANDLTETRPSIHGDVVHARPLVVDQGGSPDVTTIYYGAGDGTFRSVNAGTGKENWAFIAPEQTDRFGRLQANSPLVSFPGQPTGITPTPIPKYYFFDGSSGVYQSLDNSSVWIYPTQRRGGRMIYAFDASAPSTPTFKWRAGCLDLTSNATCTSGMSEIGQTWSTPQVAFVEGFSTTVPVVIVGGGYDSFSGPSNTSCEDDPTNSSSACNSTKGNRIYVLNGDTGAVLATFLTERSVAADIALVDINHDGYVDYAYAADTGGNLYRIEFVGSPTTVAALASTAWKIRTVAYTNGAGRKFLNAPALFAIGTKVYVALGSGDRERPLQTNYPYTTFGTSTGVYNRFYTFVDNLANVTPAASTSGQNAHALNNSARTSDASITDLDNTTTQADFSAATSCTTSGILPSSTQRGWFMDLKNGDNNSPSGSSCPAQGEQTVTSAVIIGGMVAFSTNRACPAVAGSCSVPLGQARGYFVNLTNGSGVLGVSGVCGGSRSSQFVGGGLPPSPVVARVTVGGVVKTVCIGCADKGGGVSVPIQASQINPPVNLKRHPVYWFTSGDN